MIRSDVSPILIELQQSARKMMMFLVHLEFTKGKRELMGYLDVCMSCLPTRTVFFSVPGTEVLGTCWWKMNWPKHRLYPVSSEPNACWLPAERTNI